MPHQLRETAAGLGRKRKWRGLELQLHKGGLGNPSHRRKKTVSSQKRTGFTCSKLLCYRFAQGFAYGGYELSIAKTRTRRERLLGEMARDHTAHPSAAAVGRPQRSSDGGCADRGTEDAPICGDQHDQRSDSR